MEDLIKFNLLYLLGLKPEEVNNLSINTVKRFLVWIGYIKEKEYEEMKKAGGKEDMLAKVKKDMISRMIKDQQKGTVK